MSMEMVAFTPTSYPSTISKKSMLSPYDPVTRPAHYAQGRKFEPISVIEDWGLTYHLGNALKYISRAGRKNDFIEDIEKAIWYLNRAKEAVRNVPGPVERGK